MVYFKCIRCLKKFSSKYNILKHLNIKKKCEPINTNSLLMTNEKIIEESTIKIDDFGEKVKQINKQFKCENCNKSFCHKQSMNRHQKEYCNEKNKTSIYDNSINTFNNTTTNITNNNTNYINNINNINLNVTVVRGFEEKWDLSKRDRNTLILLLISDSKHVNTFEELMNNDANLNLLKDDTNSIY